MTQYNKSNPFLSTLTPATKLHRSKVKNIYTYIYGVRYAKRVLRTNLIHRQKSTGKYRHISMLKHETNLLDLSAVFSLSVSFGA